MSHARERSDRAGEGMGGGIPPPTVGAFFSSKIRVSKSHFKALKKQSRELNIKFHGEELTKELFVELMYSKNYPL